MNRILATSILAGAAVFASAASAQESTVSGAAGGAATGAVIGGPVGAAVGGVAGAVIGSLLEPPPPEVRTVVIEQTIPSVVYDQPVVVGQPLPTIVVLYPVPGYENYYYTIVNNERVIVDPQSRVVMQVID